MPSRARLPIALLALATALAAVPAGAQEACAPPAPPVTLEAVTVTPERPAPDTLLQLRVAVRNAGERIASQLAFAVTVEGVPLPVYRNQIFMEAIPPGETKEIRLYNFWSNETARPLPADGRITVEVALTEASWYTIENVEEGDETIEEWTPIEAVPGLPSARTVTLEMAGVAAEPKTD